jgi:hypothetical protein
MMTKYYYGGDEVAGGWDRYFTLCNSIEVPWQADDRPSVKTFNTWRVKSPRGFAFVVQAQPLVVETILALSNRGATSFTADFDATWKATADRARALGAKAIVVATPFDFAPGPANRALIADFGRRAVEASKVPILWEATGMWSPEDAAELASTCGLTLVHDPFANFDTDEVNVYGKSGDAALIVNERGGARRNFDTDEMESLFDATRSFDRVFILLRGRYKWRHAREFKALLDFRE